MSAYTRLTFLAIVFGTVVGCSILRPMNDAIKLPENFRQLSTRIYSSGEPSGDSAFRALKQEGIKTIISVDGTAPEVANAKKCGIAYVHLPIGYDGVPPATIVAMDRVLHSTEGKLLIHCHHGKHRGPAAAVIAAMAEGSISNTQALARLTEAGTSPDYSGLWRDVREFRGVPTDVQPQPLVEKATIDPLADSMVRIDHAFERIEKLLNEASPATTSLTEQAILLNEGFKEAMRAATKLNRSTPLQKRLSSSQEMSADLVLQVKSSDVTRAIITSREMKTDCRACHARHRN